MLMVQNFWCVFYKLSNKLLQEGAFSFMNNLFEKSEKYGSELECNNVAKPNKLPRGQTGRVPFKSGHFLVSRDSFAILCPIWAITKIIVSTPFSFGGKIVKITSQ